jgi:hypothetical protein
MESKARLGRLFLPRKVSIVKDVGSGVNVT